MCQEKGREFSSAWRIVDISILGIGVKKKKILQPRTGIVTLGRNGKTQNWKKKKKRKETGRKIPVWILPEKNRGDCTEDDQNMAQKKKP